MERDHPQEVVIASPSGSPELNRQKCEDDDLPADLELDGLLAQQDDAKVLTDAGAPAWAVALQNSLQHQIQRSQGLMMTFHERLQRLESKEPQCNSDYDRRLQNLERMLAEFTGASAGQVSSDPPHPSGRTPTARPDFLRPKPSYSFTARRFSTLAWTCMESEPQSVICTSRVLIRQLPLSNMYPSAINCMRSTGLLPRRGLPSCGLVLASPWRCASKTGRPWEPRR